VDIEPQSQERRVATETASVWGIAVQVAAYAGVAMGLVGTVALVATSVDPSDTTLLLVAIAVTAVLFAAGIAISGEPISSNQRLRSVLWFAALLGWASSCRRSWWSPRSTRRAVRARCCPRPWSRPPR
jgi:FtsH-binding integral membrane protein